MKKTMTEEALKQLEEIKAEEERLQEERDKAYEDFFGEGWEDFEQHYLSEDRSPEEALQILMEEDEVDQCCCCDRYFWIKRDNYWYNDDFHSVYYCPYCGELGSGSDSDPLGDYEREMEHRWEAMNDR